MAQRSWFDTFFGALYDDGDELELLGGVNFVGFTITADTANGRYTIVNPSASGATPGGAAGAAQYNDGASGFAGAGWSFVDVAGSFVGFASTSASAYVAMGASPATTGALRLSNAGNIYQRGAGALVATNLHVIGYAADNVCVVGDANAVEVDINTSTVVDINIAAALSYRFGATQFDVMNKPIVGLASLRQNGTPAGSGFVRVISNAGIVIGYRSWNGTTRSALTISGDGASFDDIIVGDSNATDGCTSLYAGARIQFVVQISANNEYTFTSTGANWSGNNITNLAKVNAATVVAPVEGAAVTTTATINVSQGNLRPVSSAGGAYSLTIGTTGSPYTGESITLYSLTALANAITVVNGGAGGGNVGFSAGTIPAGFKGSATWYYDGTNWALAIGSIYRVP